MASVGLHDDPQVLRLFSMLMFFSNCQGRVKHCVGDGRRGWFHNLCGVQPSIISAAKNHLPLGKPTMSR